MTISSNSSVAASTPGTVFIIDEDESTARSLSQLVREAGYAARQFPSPDDFLASQSSAQPGCVVAELNVLEANRGLELQLELVRAEHPMPLIFVTADSDVRTTVRAIKAGALDLLTKPVHGPTLLDAVQQALEAHARGCAARDELSQLRARMSSLTPRERQVCDLVAGGLLNKQIAADLGTCVQTVKVHRGRVMSKLQVDSVAELVRLVDRLRGG